MAARAVKLRHISEVPKMKYPPALVKRLLGIRTLSTWFGPPGTRKTFLLLDLSFHIALGLEWRGRKVKQGAVIYCPLEGYLGVKARAQAWAIYYDIDLATVPLFIADPITLGIQTPKGGDDAEKFAKAVIEIAGDAVFIVIDTVNRAMAGDESSTKDMSAFVKAADTIKSLCRAHVALVHHTGKDVSKGARGSSVLIAAVDTEISISLGGDITVMEVTKQRDFESGDAFNFIASDQIEVGLDEDGEPVHSIVLLGTEREPEAKEGGNVDERAQKLLGKICAEQKLSNDWRIENVEPFFHVAEVSAWKAAFIKARGQASESAHEKAFRRVRKSLLEADEITMSNDGRWATVRWKGGGNHDAQTEAPF